MRKTIALRAATLVAIMLCIISSTLAQNRTITGRVTDQSGAGIPGVTVTVRGTGVSTQTASDGTYRIAAPDNGILVFTSVGFTSIEADTRGKTTVDATLGASASNLSEVVVIGYGTARRKDVTGAVTSVAAKDFNKGVYASPDQLVQGVVAGLEVTNNTGQP